MVGFGFARKTENTHDRSLRSPSLSTLSSSAGMSGALDPLQSVELEESQGDLLEEGDATSRSDQTSVVLHWSVEQVRIWLEHNVPLRPGRLQEVVRRFASEDVDGLSLLTLHRDHHGCVGMSDAEWLVLKVARRWLMAQGDRPLLPMPSKLNIENTPVATPPSTPQSAGSEKGGSGLRDHYEKPTLMSSPRKHWAMPRIQWGSTKDEQEEALEREVQSLRGEIVGAEERETTHLAQLDHVDEVLRTAQLASYLHTRTRWTALPGEPPADDTDVDDWLLRFLVLRGSSICFYLRATDLRPQGTIMRSEIVDLGPIPNKVHHQGDPRWSAFHITTCHGLRLECSSELKIQVDCWLTVISGGYGYDDLSRLSPPAVSTAWLKKVHYLVKWIDSTGEQPCRGSLHEGQQSVIDQVTPAGIANTTGSLRFKLLNQAAHIHNHLQSKCIDTPPTQTDWLAT